MFLLSVVTTILFFIWRYYKTQQNYWRDRGIAGPKSRLFFGNFYDLFDLQRPSGLVLREWTKKYGKVYGVQEGVRNVLVVSDQEMLQELFTKKFDDFYARKNNSLAPDSDDDVRVTLFHASGLRWKRLRTISAATFSSNSLRKIMPTVQDSSLELVRLLEPHVDGDAINIHTFYKEFTMDVISRIAMGQNGSRMFNNPISELASKIFMRKMDNPFYALASAAFP